jgi:tRNA-2-methylthio-N6-dimethylallyladenosine synthase
MRRIESKALPDREEAVKRPPVDRRLDERPIPENLLSFAQGRFFCIKTYGCQANVRDEEIMAGYLTAAGFRRTEDPAKANLAVINTCAVREGAEEKIYGEIGSFKANKAKDPSFMLVVAGCVMGEEGKALALAERYPFISLLIGTHEVSDLLPLLSEALTQKKTVIAASSFASEVVEGMPSARLSPFEAYVNISYGCDKFCTYCIVPYTRGRERSRHEEDVLKECQNLVEEGYQEITLLGQNVNSYGLDLHDGSSFAGLLGRVAALGVPRLRFLTSYPSQFDDATIEAMASHPNIAKCLHLPVQSGSDSCLRRMGRRYTREEYLALVGRLRAKMPGLALTTDLIVGFPGETEEEFADTLSLCAEVGYSAAFTFIYSPRPGTPAAKMEPVPPAIAHERFDRLKALIERTTADHSASMVGGTYEVLAEGPSKRDAKVLSGYAENGKLINFPGPAYLAGSFVPVKVTASHVYSLMGELAGDPAILKARSAANLLAQEPALREYLRLEGMIRSDPEIKELAESLVVAKQRMALSLADPVRHAEAKASYEAALRKLRGHPALHNRDALKDEVEAALREAEDLLR